MRMAANWLLIIRWFHEIYVTSNLQIFGETEFNNNINFVEKILNFVVTEFVKLSDEVITELEFLKLCTKVVDSLLCKRAFWKFTSCKQILI